MLVVSNGTNPGGVSVMFTANMRYKFTITFNNYIYTSSSYLNRWLLKVRLTVVALLDKRDYNYGRAGEH